MERRAKYRSKYRGLTYVPVYDNWMVRIVENGKRKFIGEFKCEEEAARAYDREALRIYGERAVLNFPAGNKGRLYQLPVSQYHGVSFEAASGKWRARLTVRGKVHSLGRYAEEEDAARTYDQAVVRHGVESELNFPGEDYRLRVVA
jgi:hypothetical protein